MNNPVVTIAVAIIGSGVLTTILNRVFAIQDKKSDKDDALRCGMRELLYSTIKDKCIEYETRGSITESDYNSLKRMWSVYHNQLGGNGYLDSYISEIERLEKI